MSVYTKKGDRGATSTLSSDGKVDKDSAQVEALGAIDELNSYIGVAILYTKSTDTINGLKQIRTNLFTIASIIAGSDIKFSIAKTNQLERAIDKMEHQMPEIKHFIVSGGSEASVHLHYARALSRRAERRVVTFSKHEKVSASILKYMNRLSDSLFTYARFVNHQLGINEEHWLGKKEPRR